MELKLKNKKLTTIGGSQGFIVDKAFINNGHLEKDKEYDLTIILSSKGGGSNSWNKTWRTNEERKARGVFVQKGEVPEEIWKEI